MKTTNRPTNPEALQRLGSFRKSQFIQGLLSLLVVCFFLPMEQANAQLFTVKWADLDNDGRELFANDPDEFEEEIDYTTEVNTFVDSVNHEENPLHGITSAAYPVTGATAVPANWSELTQVISNFGGSGIDVTLEFSPNTDDSGRTGGPNLYGADGGTNPDSAVTGRHALRMVNDKTVELTPFTTVVTFSEPVLLDELILASLSRISGDYENAFVRAFEGPHATGNTVEATTYLNISDLADDSTLVHNLGVPPSVATVNDLANLALDLPSTNFTYHAIGLLDQTSHRYGRVKFAWQSTPVQSIAMSTWMTDTSAFDDRVYTGAPHSVIFAPLSFTKLDPCPGNVLVNESFENGNFTGNTPFAGGLGMQVPDNGGSAPDDWEQDTDLNVGGVFWIDSTAAYKGSKYAYLFTSGTTNGTDDACLSPQSNVTVLPNTTYNLCVWAADAKADGDASGLALEVQEIGGSFHFKDFAVPDNPAWDDGALTGIPWQRYCYTFTTGASTTALDIWISASAAVGGSTSYLVVDEACLAPSLQLGLGNLVFNDLNKNGTYDSGEGVDGVNVQLWDPVNGIIGDGDDVQVDDPNTLGTQNYEVATSNGGCYLFSRLAADDYYVKIPASEFGPGKPLETAKSITGTQVGDDDVGEDGIDGDEAANGITSGVITLAVDTGPTDGGAGALAETGKDNASDNADDNNTDLTVDFGFEFPTGPQYDLGDLPEGGLKDFPTAGSNAADRARHLLGSGLTLGSTVDSENDGQPSIGADGDGADEDGFPYLPNMMPGQSYAIPFTATVPGAITVPVYLNGWIDYNCDGTFQAGEQIATDLIVTDGANTIPAFTVPTGAIPGTTYSRFRLSTTSGLSASGDAPDGEVEDYVSRILRPIGAIGNYVWVDENSDGAQDPGEPGIPNVTVKLLLDADGSGPNPPVVVQSTQTDTSGGYLFTDLASGCYYVDIEDSSIPTGYTQTTIFTKVIDGPDADSTTDDGDFGNKSHSGSGYKIDLDPNETNLTADFGYNVNPSDDVNNGTNEAAIGDKIWFDLDQDGRKDANEVGLAGVTVELTSAGPDNLFGTADDVSAAATATTDANGCYLFDGLEPDAYVVTVTDTAGALTGFTQTGDPDHFGTTGTNNDGATTVPVVLGPGDVFLNADFGYYLDPVNLGRIGDRVWLDEDNSGDATDGDKSGSGLEPGLSGVTVALIADTNKNGMVDAGEKIIATDLTDADGCYLFEGLPVDADGKGYLVLVNDTNNVLAGLSRTYDDDGSLDNLSGAVLTIAVPESLTEDFSYTPKQAAYGSIGDTIWLDLDNSGGNQSTQGGEPGINNVLVTLKDFNGNTVGTTRTDSNGNYLFNNLPFGDYTVEVDPGTLPAGLNTTPTYDPTAPTTDSISSVTISMSAPNNREQDFSYTPDTTTVGSVGDKVWVDASANNTVDGDSIQAAGELGLAGVTVTLTPPTGVDAGNGVDVPLTTVTDAKGCYLFTDQPFSNDPYTVTITPPAGFVNDYDSESPGDGTSTVVVNAGTPNPRDQDFSVETTTPLYSIGNTIWFDADSDGDRTEDPGNDGSADPREAPLAGVRVDLCDSSGNTIATTVTDATGQYLFENLFAGTYTVKVDTSTLPDGVNPISTYEKDGAGTDSRVEVTLVDADILDIDFSYPPLGGIGDTVFFDGNDNDSPDAGEGLEGITVTLCDANGNALATTVTDINGFYYFGDLPAGTYTVKVDTATLPAGLVNTEDPDTDPDTLASPGDNESEVTIGVGETNLDQDFGYQGEAGRIGNLVWLDLDADGIYDGPAAGETPIGGVTVDLYLDTDGNGTRDSGEPFLGTTTTEAALNPALGTDGNYCFENLPAGNYIVEVSDRDGVLGGYWHSLGTAGENNNSQEEAFALGLATVPGDQKNADFGYYLDPGKLGNFVFSDSDKDGIQDSNESGIDGNKLTLTITYPNNDIVTLSTISGDDPSTIGVVEQGWYNFCNLLLDEDYRGAGGGTEPTYSIAITLETGQVLTLADQGVVGPNQDLEDSDASGVSGQPFQGSQNVAQNADPTAEDPIASYDFGIVDAPKSAAFADFLVDNAELFGLDDNSLPGVPAIDPLTGIPSDPASTDPANDDFGTAGAPNPGLTGNVDGDVYNNLLEFALCFDPGSGAKAFPNGDPNKGFHLELNGSSLDAKFNQPTGVTDVTYQVEISTDGQTWDALTGITPVVVAGPVSGSTTVCYPGINVTNPGLLRLKVSAGSTTSVTGPVGWQMANVKDFCQTYSDPLLEPCLVTGTITGVAGHVLDLTQAAGTQSLTTRLEAGKSYYLEVMSGDNLGHIFDIASFDVTSVTLATDTDLCALSAPYSTKLTVPSDLAADMFIIREHKTLENLFPIDDLATGGVPEGFAAGVNASNSGKLIRYNRDGGLESYIANSGPGGANTWVASTTGPGAPDNILPPGEGIFTHNLLGEPDLPILQFGEVRATQLAVPLKEGYNFVAAAHPIVSQSIDGEDSTSRLLNASGSPFTFEGNGARSLADQVQFWQDDTAADAASTHICYDMIFYLRNASGTVDIWSKGGISTPTTEEGKGLFDPTRSAMYCIQKDDMLDYYLPSPISNAVN
ncbi:SdrD B-like domain-containing protein [Verrucomicrobiaceae bacterium 227]